MFEACRVRQDDARKEICMAALLTITVVSGVEFPQLRLTQLADPEGNLFNVATWQAG